MIRSAVAIVGLASLVGCSGTRDRPVAAGEGNRSVAAARVDTTGLTSVADSARPSSRPADRPKRAAVPAPRRAPVTVSDTESVAGYAPEVEAADTGAVAADTITMPTPDTVAVPISDTVARTPTDSAPPPEQPAAPTPGPEPAAASTSGAGRTLPVGTEIAATFEDSLDSRHDSAGTAVMARVADDVRGQDNRILVPAGSRVQLRVTRLEPAKSKSAADGKLELSADTIMIADRRQPLSADVRPIPHEIRGRGVTAGEAEKVGVGAAGGAVLGRVIGKNTKGAVIGGVIGAAGGAVVASQTASRDVVVHAGTRFTMVLTAPLTAGQLR